MEKICKQCKKTYEKPYKFSKKQWEKSIFCSKKCSNKGFELPLIEVVCEVCGKRKYKKRRSDCKYRFCSKKCAGTASFEIANKRDRTGSKNPAWKGGIRRDVQQYKYILINGLYYAEHKLLVEKKIGRKLLKGEVIHHINGIKTDNRIENLQLCKNQSEHMKIHMAQRLVDPGME